MILSVLSSLGCEARLRRTDKLESAMPDIAKIKAGLEAKLKELTARAEEIDDDLSKPADDDWEEHATESEDDEVLEKVGDVTLDEIRQIKYALSQIEAGSYGLCAKCGGSIGKERLEALPFATNCIQCS